ncbi:MAG: hypothetical protein WD176_02040 [Pirellulales bacterium]
MVAGLTGCGGAAAKTLAVTGKVTYADGTPVKNGEIAFQGTQAKAYGPTGTIKEDGTYQLSTFEENDGAPAGEYTVVVSANGETLTVLDPTTAIKVESGKTNFDIKVEKGTGAAPPSE